ncbi:MAG: HEPN domain-containing protein [Sideroxydans sp.]|nr:HEPN domain-containing protein [Sideroxydans sp.]
MTQPIERARRLLVLAERDITSFRALTTHPEVDISATGFFAQQVVEKCLKSIAEYHGIVFRRTHDVDELVDLLLQHKIAMPFPPDQFSNLNPFAVILRYEETPYVSMTLDEMKKLVNLAYEWAKGVIAG